jgi:hypothetical protein
MSYNQDVEDIGERTPMLGNSSRQGSSSEGDDDSKWSALYVLQFLGGGIYAPDPSTYDPVEILLNTEDEGKRDALTKQWRDNKLSELSFVGVVVRTSIHSQFQLRKRNYDPDITSHD